MKHKHLPSHVQKALTSNASLVEVEIELSISSGAGLLFVDTVPIPLHGSTGRVFVTTGDHYLVWGGQSAPNASYTVAIKAPGTALWNHPSTADDRGYLGGGHPFTV